ncbi:hypothetical protein NLO95_14780 [Pseudomonas syringae]|nr:hypothetical protein [Pseudomonas syringae]
MNIPIPINFILKAVRWTWARITKLMLHKTYLQSHRKWNARHRLGARWQKLGEHLEYSIRLAQPTDPEPQTSRFAIRSTGGRLETVDLYFEASGAGLRYQEKISAYDVDRSPMIWNLNNIPVQRFLGGLDEGIHFSVEEYQLLNCVVKLSSNQLSSPINSVRAYLTHNWIMNDDWKRRWDGWWNYNAIKFAKGELAMYWRLGLGMPSVRIYSPYARKSSRSSFIRPILRAFCSFMALPPLVTAQFWIAIWSGLYVMGDDDRLRFRWRGGSENAVNEI